MEATPVPLAQDPGEHVHLVMQLGRELGADQIRRPGPFASRDQLHVVVVATVLRGQRGALVGQHGADAEAGRRLVDVQAFFGPAGIAPPIRLALLLVGDVDGAVDGLRGVAARAAGELCQNLVKVLLEEVVLAA